MTEPPFRPEQAVGRSRTLADVLRVGATAIELSSADPGGPGIREVRVGEHVLRSGDRPMFVEVRNPWGVELCNLRVEARTPLDDGGVAVAFAADRREGGPMEWMCHEVRNRVSTADWSMPPAPAEGTRLTLEFRPVARTLGAFTLNGFSYRYVYESPDIPIYKLLDRSTWEIGGSAAGNTIWLPQGHGPSVFAFDDGDEAYSTEWYLPTISQPNIFQFMPLQTGMQGFTFLSHAHGALVTWATEVAHIRTLIHKRRGERVIPHFHEHCGDLANRFSTSPVEVLFCAGEMDAVDLMNLHHEVRELVHESLHEQIGMRRERITTYGVLEEWGNADLVHYRQNGLPKLANAGCRTLMLPNHFQNDMNTYGLSNMCCTVDLKVAESVGEDNLTDFCQAARDRGMMVEMWGNTSISTTAERFSHRQGSPGRVDFLPLEDSIMEALAADPQAFVRNPSGAIEADHYTPRFCVMNLRSQAVRDYWMKRWKHAHDHVGLGGIFLDSSFNLSSDKFHWVYRPQADRHGATDDQITDPDAGRPDPEPPSAILSQYHAHLSLMVEMQQAGYRYCAEDRGVFGISRTGGSGAQRADSLPLWPDCFCSLDPKRIAEAGLDPDDVFFRGLAYRMMWSLRWNPKTDALGWSDNTENPLNAPTEWQFAMLKTFDAVEARMHHRTILPGESGVVYHHGDEYVLWAFEAFELLLAGPARVENVTTGQASEGQTIPAEAHNVYTWSGVACQ